jgi:hypothetical protein
VAIRKATTTKDIFEEPPAEEVPAEAPKETETVTDEVDVSASDPEPEREPQPPADNDHVAPGAEPFPEPEPDPERAPAPKGYTHLVGPSGTISTVPDSILDALLDSGYTKK